MIITDTGLRTLRLTSENSPGSLVFSLSPIVAKELASDHVDIIISSSKSNPILCINGNDVVGVYEQGPSQLDAQVKTEEVVGKAEETIKKEEPDIVVRTKLHENVLYDDEDMASEISESSSNADSDGSGSHDPNDLDSAIVLQQQSGAEGSHSRHNTRSVANSDLTHKNSAGKKRTVDADAAVDKIFTKKQKTETSVKGRTRSPRTSKGPVAKLKKKPVKGNSKKRDKPLSEAPGALKSSLKLPTNGRAQWVEVAGVVHEAWRVPPETLTSKEREWLETQKGLRYGYQKQKPVAWSRLGLRMFHEAEKRKDPEGFRPLFHETLGAAWNEKLWRFPGQHEEFPVFNDKNMWTDWLKTDWGIRWVAGEGRALQDKMPRARKSKYVEILD